MKKSINLIAPLFTLSTIILLGAKTLTANPFFHNPFYDMIAYGLFVITFVWLIIRWIIQPKPTTKPETKPVAPAVKLEDFIQLSSGNGLSDAAFSGKLINGKEQEPTFLVLQRLAK